LDGAWYYIGIQKFDGFINVLKSDLDEIDKIIIEMNGLAENLIKILDNMSRRLKNTIFHHRRMYRKQDILYRSRYLV
jgi:hypothetical protein